MTAERGKKACIASTEALEEQEAANREAQKLAKELKAPETVSCVGPKSAVEGKPRNGRDDPDMMKANIRNHPPPILLSPLSKP